MLGVVWVAFAAPLALLVESGFAALTGTAVSLGFGVAALGIGRSSSEPTVRTAAYLLAIAAVTGTFLAATFLVTSLVVAIAGIALSDALLDVAARTGAAVTLVLASGCTLGLLAAFRDVDGRTNLALALRMYVALVLVALCAVCFFTASWVAAFLLALLWLPTSIAFLAAAGATAIGTVAFGYLEYGQVLVVEDRAGAEPVDPASYPDLHAVVARVAAQLDVPVPTIAVADRPAPEAMVVGFRPDDTRLVVSTGTLAALDAEQLEAVVAHELAHVAHRDAMVVTVVSAPVVVARGILARTNRGDAARSPLSTDGDDSAGTHTDLTEAELYGEDGEWRVRPETERDDDGGTLLDLFRPVPLVTWACGLAIVAMLSRARETIADRTAAEVTGSPAAVASALRTMDERVEAVPDRDLRRASGVSALSIVPLDPDGFVRGDDDVGPTPGFLARLKRRLLGTHPPTETRLERLQRFELDDES